MHGARDYVPMGRHFASGLLPAVEKISSWKRLGIPRKKFSIYSEFIEISEFI